MGTFRRILTGALACMLLLAGNPAMAASGQHEVTAGKLNFREKASTDSGTIDSLSRGTVVTVLSTSGGWAKVRWDGQTGYLSCEYLEKIDSASVSGRNTTELSGTGWLEKDSVLYEAADTDSDKLAELPKGEKLSLRGETVNFYYVKADGEYGYILKSRVSRDEVEGDGASSGGSSSSGVLKNGDEGERVGQIQERLSELGYLDEEYITGYFGDLTERAICAYQKAAGLDADGVYGPMTRESLFSGRAPEKKKVIEMDWFDSDVSDLVYKRGGTAYIIDCDTGVKIKIRRVGGSNHMDVEPATASDTGKLLDIYGGEWSWDQRAVILIADGKYIAASINGMPHGDEISSDNNFDGHFCLHTTGSMTHGTEKVNGRHQDQVERALDYM